MKRTNVLCALNAEMKRRQAQVRPPPRGRVGNAGAPVKTVYSATTLTVIVTEAVFRP